MVSALLQDVQEAWIELRQNLGRSVLQALGVVLGVASVLGGFSISDSQRRKSEELFVKLGGLDKLAVHPLTVVDKERPTALEAANLGLRGEEGTRGATLAPSMIGGVAYSVQTNVVMRSIQADRERPVTGIGEDYIPMNGYALARGRSFSLSEFEQGAPVAILGSEAAVTFFPNDDAVGQVMTVGERPVTVVGVFQERVFRFQAEDHNILRRRNRIVAVPAAFVQLRLQGDAYRRVDDLGFRIPDLKAMVGFGDLLTGFLRTSHRLQEDFRLDDLSKRVRKAKSQEEVYDLIFLLSGVLALLGGGIVNVNIQMASLKDRVREIGLKMAIGASGDAIFRAFMTETLLLSILGTAAGLISGVLFSWAITQILGIPLHMRLTSFLWAFLLAGCSGFLSALYPAWKASRLSPMEALRYE